MANWHGSVRICSYSAGVSSISLPQSAEPHSHTKPTRVVSSSTSRPRSMSSLSLRKVASLRAIRSSMSVDTPDSLIVVRTDRTDRQQGEVVAKLASAQDERLVLDRLDHPRERLPHRPEDRVAQRGLAAE